MEELERQIAQSDKETSLLHICFEEVNRLKDECERLRDELGSLRGQLYATQCRDCAGPGMPTRAALYCCHCGRPFARVATVEVKLEGDK